MVDLQIAGVLMRQGVTLLQGGHFGKPMSAEDFEHYLPDNPRGG